MKEKDILKDLNTLDSVGSFADLDARKYAAMGDKATTLSKNKDYLSKISKIAGNDLSIYPLLQSPSEIEQYQRYLMSNPKVPDVRDMTPKTVFETIKRGDPLLHYPESDAISQIIGKTRGQFGDYYLRDGTTPREAAWDIFHQTMNQEKKFESALSHGIRETKGFKLHHSDEDVAREIFKDLGLDNPKFNRKELPKGVAGWANPYTNTIEVDPRKYSMAGGREVLFGHEGRHLKEGIRPSLLDDSVRNTLYAANSPDPLQAFYQLFNRQNAIDKSIGHQAGFYKRIKDRLHPNDVLKESIDAGKLYSFLERGHFADDFLMPNLKRVAKGLPIAGVALGVLSNPNDASAGLIEGLDPTGLLAPERIGGDPEVDAIEDPRVIEKNKQIANSKIEDYYRTVRKRSAKPAYMKQGLGETKKTYNQILKERL